MQVSVRGFVRNFHVIFFVWLGLSACGVDTSSSSSGSSYDPRSVPGTQIGVLISFDDLHRTFPLSYEDTEIDGLKPLQDTGLSTILADFGGNLGFAVCSIDGIGEPESNCFGNSENYYWSIFIKRFGTSAWVDAPEGVSGLSLEDGDILAFLWTQSVVDSSGVSSALNEPIQVNLSEIFRP